MSEHPRCRSRRHERGERGQLPGRHHRTPNHPTEGAGNRDWWPNQLNLKILAQEPRRGRTRWAPSFDYAAAFKTLDLAAREAATSTRC